MGTFSGSFKNNSNHTIQVTITSPSGADVSIGASYNSVCHFSDDEPVRITWDLKDSFDIFNLSSATINLVSKNYYGDSLFQGEARKVAVNITDASLSRCLFSGFVTPNTYNQDWNNIYDEFAVECIDALSILQYFNYTTKSAGKEDIVTFKNILERMLALINENGTVVSGVFISNSKRLTQSDSASIISSISVSETNFFDDDEKHTPWKWDEVIEQCLQYLNLHIVQDGDKIIILDFEQIKSGVDATYTCIAGSGSYSPYNSVISLGSQSNPLYAESATSISMADTYQKITVKESLVDVDSAFGDMFNEELFTSTQTTERLIGKICKSSGWQIGDGGALLPKKDETYQEESWYAIFYDHPGFTKHWYGNDLSYTVSYPDSDPAVNLSRYIGAQLMRLRSETIKTTDNSSVSKRAWQTYLAIPVHGNYPSVQEDSQAKSKPQYPSGKSPLDYPVFEGTPTGAVNLVPTTSDGQNFVCISGKILMSSLNRYMGEISGLSNWLTAFVVAASQEHENDPKLWWSDGLAFDVPNTEDQSVKTEKAYRGASDEIDLFGHIPVLAAQLQVGDKYWCGIPETASGYWTTTPSYFPIQIDPGTKQPLIGKEYPFENQFTTADGVDCEGIRIPISQADGVNGTIKFSIYGPMPAWFDQWSDYYHGWWITEKHYWDHDWYYLPGRTEMIYVSGLKIEVKSKGSLVNTKKNQDYKVFSDENDEYVNTKSDIEFKVNTQPEDKVSLSSVVGPNGKPLLKFYDQWLGQSESGEFQYVEQKWKEYSKPKMILECTLWHKDEWDFHTRFMSTSLNKTFYVQSMKRDLMLDTVEYKLKEV